MKKILLIFFLGFSYFLKGQGFTPEVEVYLDSLNQIILNQNSEDSSLGNAYIKVSNLLYVSNIDTVIPLCEKAKFIAEKKLKEKLKKTERKKYLTILADAFNNIGYVLGMKGDVDSQINYYKKSLKTRIEIGDAKGVATSLNNIGYVFKNQGNIEQALIYYRKSLKKREELGDKKGIASCLSNMGVIYNGQGDFDKAIEYYEESLKLQKDVDDKKGMANSIHNIGFTYKLKGNKEQALIQYQKSLALYKQIENDYGIAHSLNNIGAIQMDNADYEKALLSFNECIAIRRRIEDKKGIASSLKNLGNVYFLMKKYKEALSFTNESLLIGKEIGYPEEIKNSSGLLSKIYEELGQEEQALEMYKLSILMRDSLSNSEAQKIAAQQQAEYEYEKQKAVDDAEHEKQLAIEQEAKEKQQILTYATAGGLGLVGIFLIFVFNRLKVTRKQKAIIEVAHKELEEKNTEILDSITYAKRIQSAILPPDRVVKEYLQESFVLYKPKDIVAGDFYWLEQKENKVLFAAADCTGHGVPGAMVSVVCNNGLNRSVREYGLTDPGKILGKTREIVVQEFEKSEEEVKDGMDIALCSLEGNTLYYAGANNPLWIIRNNTEEIEEIKADKQSIGQTDSPLPYITHRIELQKGDTFYVFSDGYADQFGGEQGKKMKTANFKKLLLSIQQENMQKQKQLINEAFESWKGELEQLDDVCVIGVRI